ncbi:MAG TPA: LPS export ABC transporter periplasmic protein LptC, partial [Elusimicrobiota bacterium]|nr:LPS export ABC transporter periplasmic protein LptC [Elusimicrobiota bacterium]
QKNWTLSASRADVYEREQRMAVETPHVLFYKAGQLSSTLDAQHGSVRMDSKDMWIGGQLVMESTTGVRLSSDWMNYFHAEQKIVSTAPVVIVRPGSVTHGQAWEAKPDLSELVVYNQRVDFDSQAKTP